VNNFDRMHLACAADSGSPGRPPESWDRFPHISGLNATYAGNGSTAVVTGMWKAPQGINGPLTPIGPADTVRFVTNDFTFTGSDGCAVFASGTNVLTPPDHLLQVAVDHVAANSPVGPVVEGRIVGP
jgi:hypothetical protein